MGTKRNSQEHPSQTASLRTVSASRQFSWGNKHWNDSSVTKHVPEYGRICYVICSWA